MLRYLKIKVEIKIKILNWYFPIDNNKLLEKYKIIKIEDLKNIKLNALPVYEYRYVKTKIRTYNKV